MEDEVGREHGRQGRNNKFMILFEKLEGRGQLGDSCRWKGNIETQLTKIGCEVVKWNKM
jgi:hypothetical protein